MKFIVNSKDLLDKLNVLVGVVNTTNTMPILDNVLFELNQDTLNLTTSDLDTTISTKIQVESEDEDAFCLPARMLLDVLKTFSPQPLTFSKTEKTKNDKEIMTFVSRKGRYQLSCLNANEFPTPIHFPSPDEIVLPSDNLSLGLKNTLFSVGPEEVRKVLSGVYFNFDQKSADLVSTDGHKMSLFSLPSIKREEPVGFIVPKKPLTLLQNMLSSYKGDVIIEHNKSNARFKFDSSVVICRLVDGRYPNYKNVFPQHEDLPNILTLDRTQFINILQRITYFTSESTSEASIKLKGNSLTIDSRDVEYGKSGEETINCQYKGEDMELGYNIRHLLEMMKTVETEEVTLRISRPNSISLLSPIFEEKEQDFRVEMLIMPIR